MPQFDNTADLLAGFEGSIPRCDRLISFLRASATPTKRNFKADAAASVISVLYDPLHESHPEAP
ncbi:MAG: hypothetical protein GW900_00305 [Gammaproteobacteria bacterium]|nr:hypothetical protein [Gammaproteobacteria bacterium]